MTDNTQPQQADIESEVSLVKADQSQCLTFILGDETYGIDILRVQEIRGWEKPTKLPNMPGYIKGAINMRGSVVPIVDLRERFHISSPTYDETTVVMIVNVLTQAEGSGIETEKTIGLVVDGVSDVQAIDRQSLQEAPSFTEERYLSGDYVKGIATVGEVMVIVLDVDILANQGIFQKITKH